MLPYAFRIVGPVWEQRRLVDAGAAFQGYARCDCRAQVDREAYLSAFQFGEDFRALLEAAGSTAGFTGPCWAPWVWFDIDRDNLAAALRDAQRLAHFLLYRYLQAEDYGLLVFFSGSKGFHIGLSTYLWEPQPSSHFHCVAREFAERIAAEAKVTIDVGVYDRVRAFRAPNSKHPKTGLHKRHLTLDELSGLSVDRILEVAREPKPFTLPVPLDRDQQATADWVAAENAVAQEAEEKAKRQAQANGSPTLNRLTLEFIRDGAAVGDRHRLLFSAAANLAEFGCPAALAHALLTEAALNSGLPKSEVRRQIDCGLAHGRKTGNG